MMRDWLLSVAYLDALEEKARGFTKIEHQWSAELNSAGREYGVAVLGIEITTLRFPYIDQQDEKMALQMAETNLKLETSRQEAQIEKECGILNQVTHVRMQEDRNRDAEVLERKQEVERRNNTAEAETGKHAIFLKNNQRRMSINCANRCSSFSIPNIVYCMLFKSPKRQKWTQRQSRQKRF